MNNNDLMSMLMGTLSNPDAKDKLLNIAASLGAGDKKENPNELKKTETENIPKEPVKALDISRPQSSSEFMSAEMISKIKGMLDNFNRVDDSRIGLLNSIRPYMKSGRVKNIDMAIKFIQFINFASGFNDTKR